MSGCRRLWPTICWSVKVFVESRGNTTWGTGDVLPVCGDRAGSLVAEDQGRGSRACRRVGGGARGPARARRRDAAHDLRGLGAALAGLDRGRARRPPPRAARARRTSGLPGPPHAGHAASLARGGHRADQVERAAARRSGRSTWARGSRRAGGAVRCRPTLLTPSDAIAVEERRGRPPARPRGRRAARGRRRAPRRWTRARCRRRGSDAVEVGQPPARLVEDRTEGGEVPDAGRSVDRDVDPPSATRQYCQKSPNARVSQQASASASHRSRSPQRENVRKSVVDRYASARSATPETASRRGGPPAPTSTRPTPRRPTSADRAPGRSRPRRQPGRAQSTR